MKVIKLRIIPNDNQIDIIEQTLDTLRFIYNQYLGANIKSYKYHTEELHDNKWFISGYDFDKYVNHDLSKDYPWIKEISSKARKDMIMIADKAFKKFFKDKEKTWFPKFKSKKKNPVKSFFIIKDGIRFDKPRCVWLPILHYTEFIDKGYYRKGILNDDLDISSARVIKDSYGRYFVSILYKDTQSLPINYNTSGLGIDLGVKTYATIYDGTYDRIFKIKHPWKGSNSKLKKYQNHIDALMKVISSKIEIKKKTGGIPATELYHSKSIDMLWSKIRKYRRKIHDYMDDFIKKLCNTLTVKAKPLYITIEDLHVTELLTDNKLSVKQNDRIAKSNWYKFREILSKMATSNGIMIRIANKYFASSKICHNCGHKNNITLSDRTITCKHCGQTFDRDSNAAMNLYDCKNYIVLE